MLALRWRAQKKEKNNNVDKNFFFNDDYNT